MKRITKKRVLEIVQKSGIEEVESDHITELYWCILNWKNLLKLMYGPSKVNPNFSVISKDSYTVLSEKLVSGTKLGRVDAELSEQLEAIDRLPGKSQIVFRSLSEPTNILPIPKNTTLVQQDEGCWCDILEVLSDIVGDNGGKSRLICSIVEEIINYIKQIIKVPELRSIQIQNKSNTLLWLVLEPEFDLQDLGNFSPIEDLF